MTRVVGWRCDRCKIVHSDMPWGCPGCEEEVCDNCAWIYGHCRACSEGKTTEELIVAANATGNFDFQLDD